MKKLPEIQQGGPIAWMAGHSVAANLVMLACLIGGFLLMLNIKKEVFPDFETDTITITVRYPGASPEEVEKGIVLAVEEAVSGLEGVDEVRSVASEGRGTVIVEALAGTDLQKLAREIQQEVDRITTFPEEAEDPIIRIRSFKREVLSIVIYGDVDMKVLHELAEQFRDQLIQDPGITQVDLTGIPPLEISIEVPRENLLRYRLTLEEIAARVRRASVELPCGEIRASSGEVLVRVKERRNLGAEFARLPIISTQNGGQILLGQIARITDGYVKTDRYATYNGKPAVMVNVYRVGDQTPIQVSEAARAYLEQFDRSLPPGVETVVLRDLSSIYEQRVNLLMQNGLMGLALVLLVLALFLEARLAFWVMMGIPVSFLGSFLLLPALGVSINMISLFAFIMAIGIVVDDAIVVGEHVYYYRQKGVPALLAAIGATREMAMPVTFSVLTNIVTFVPLYFIPGVAGKVFGQIPLVIIPVFAISLLESIFVLPSHLGHLRERERRGLFARLHYLQQGFSSSFTRWVRHRYGPFLGFVLRHRYLTATVALALLLMTLSYALSGRMGMQLFHAVESDFARATLIMPVGTPIEKTGEVVEQLTRAARVTAAETGRADELVKGIFARVGGGGGNTAVITVYLAPPDIRNEILSTQDFVRRWRKLTGELAGVKSLVFSYEGGGPGHGRGITIELNHRDLSVLQAASGELAEALRAYPSVTDVDDGFTPGKRQFNLKILSEGRSLGLSADEVAQMMRNALYGAEVLRQQRGRNELRVMVRLPEEERSSEFDIEDMTLLTRDGREIPLKNIVSIQQGRAYAEINRRNGRRVVQVQADVMPRSKTGEILNDVKTTVLPRLANAYPGLSYNLAGRQADIMKSLGSLKIFFPLALLAIYAMLAIAFNSYFQPLIIMISIPFGIIGALLGHLLMGYSLSIVSMLGIVALSGVVVNDSLVLINRANRLKRAGLGTVQQIIQAAAIQRFRPILLTTLTTFGGLTPMILETSRQARFLVPVAISLGFGVLFATFITLVLVPALYLIVEDIKGLVVEAAPEPSPHRAGAAGQAGK